MDKFKKYLAGCGFTGLNPSYSGSGCRRIMSSRLAQAKLLRPCLKNKSLKKGCGHSSSGGTFAWHVQGPRFNSRY
jgi:hypothetical protein